MRVHIAAIAATVFLAPTANLARAQLAPRCVENSPERRGEVGCSIVERKLLPDGLREAVFWHIDRFDSVRRAQAAVGPSGVAFDAGGTSWLITIESETSDHHGGHHVAEVGPLQLPHATKVAMQVQAAAFTPGLYSTIHHHSGIEAIYVMDGQACYQTATRAFMLGKGETLTIPGGTLHRAVAVGSSLRYVFAVIIYDAAEPPTVVHDGTPPRLTTCQ